MTSNRLPRIILFAAPETSAAVLYGLYDVLGSVGPAWPDVTSATSGDRLLDVRIVAARAEPFRCYGGVRIEPHEAIADVTGADVVVVCDMFTPIDAPPRGRYVEESAWLRAMHERGALIASVCAGSLVLAESGLLDGRSCAGHWAYVDLFASAYPRVRFKAGSILDLANEGAGIVTAGGATSWQELALYLIGRLCGPAQAMRTAKVYLLAGHRDGQLPFSAMTHRSQLEDRIVAESVTWIEANYATPNPVAAMTQRSGLTPRTFARRFLVATGRRPIDYVHALRIEGARDRLESGDDPVDDIGFAVGYADPTFFRRLFKRVTGLTPAAYRRMYAPILRPGQGTHRESTPGPGQNVSIRRGPESVEWRAHPAGRRQLRAVLATRCGSASPRSGRRPPAP
jgi:transcriptional regulator GlxA family with amidase domain